MFLCRFADDGTGKSTKKGKEALVLMAVGLNVHFKIPIGYFFIEGCTAERQAEIVREALVLVHETGVKPVALVCDGLRANVAMLNNLGANLSDPSDLKTTFTHPSEDYEVACILDACHMIKCVRNTWCTLKKMVDSSGRVSQLMPAPLLGNSCL